MLSVSDQTKEINLSVEVVQLEIAEYSKNEKIHCTQHQSDVVDSDNSEYSFAEENIVEHNPQYCDFTGGKAVIQVPDKKSHFSIDSERHI